MKIPQWIRVFGDTDYRGDCALESAEQVTFFAELERLYPDLSPIALHPRNEGKRTPGQYQKQRMEGMAPGAADIIIPASLTFVCELKRADHTKSKWETNQLGYLKTCFDNGAFVCVALGYEAALIAVDEWLRIMEFE